MEREYHYKDILLLPHFSELNSRSEADTSVQFGPRKFKLPIVPANMKTIIDANLAAYLAERDYFYIMHRFGVDLIDFSRTMREKGLYVSVSVGVNIDSYEALTRLKSYGSPDYIVVDISHGHCVKMRNMLQFLKFTFPTSFVIAGNTCT